MLLYFDTGVRQGESEEMNRFCPLICGVVSRDAG